MSIVLHHVPSSHPGISRLRKRRDRRLRPIRPSRANELFYRWQLGLIVAECRAAGAEIAEGLRSHWPHVGDQTAQGLEGLLARAAKRFGNITAVAERLTDVRSRLSVVRRNLGAVDERLIAAVRRSIGVDISGALHAVGPIQSAMAKAARANVDLIVSIPGQYLDLVKAAVEKAFAEGSRHENLIARIQHVGDVTESRAKLIARDQTSKMNAAFNEVRQTELGIKEYVWSGAMDRRERQTHRDMEGRRCRWDQKPLVGGVPLHPGEDYQCRCLAEPVFQVDAIAEAA